MFTLCPLDMRYPDYRRSRPEVKATQRCAGTGSELGLVLVSLTDITARKKALPYLEYWARMIDDATAEPLLHRGHRAQA